MGSIRMDSDLTQPIKQSDVLSTKMKSPKSGSDDTRKMATALNEDICKFLSKPKPRPSIKHKRRFTDEQLVQLTLHMFFRQYPLTDEEKTTHHLRLYKLIKVHWDNCRKLQVLACNSTRVFRNMMYCGMLGKELKRLCSIEEATVSIDSLVWNYHMAIFEERNLRRVEPRYLKVWQTFDIVERMPKIPIVKDYNLEPPADIRTQEECVDDLVTNFSSVEEYLEDVLGRLETCKRLAKENQTAPVEGFDPVILNHRLNFLLELKSLIRVSLVLFRRMNKGWYRSAEKIPGMVVAETLIKIRKSFLKSSVSESDEALSKTARVLEDTSEDDREWSGDSPSEPESEDDEEESGAAADMTDAASTAADEEASGASNTNEDASGANAEANVATASADEKASGTTADANRASTTADEASGATAEVSGTSTAVDKDTNGTTDEASGATAAADEKASGTTPDANRASPTVDEDANGATAAADEKASGAPVDGNEAV